ncbi:MAG: hypothetical protein IKQ24_05235 [Verrucomicrobia bacterium]|nr:hypothetical protein [Verrucomicrobiota bacterium]
MNTLGFFICWILIGIFVVLTVGQVAAKWTVNRYNKDDVRKINDDIEHTVAQVRDYETLIPRIMPVIKAFVWSMAILGWPLILPLELWNRSRMVKNREKD